MNTMPEQLVAMTHRLASIAMTPCRLGTDHQAPIRLVVYRLTSPKNFATNPDTSTLISPNSTVKK